MRRPILMKSILVKVLAAAGVFSLSAAQSSSTTSSSGTTTSVATTSGTTTSGTKTSATAGSVTTTGSAPTSAATYTVSVGVDHAYQPAVVTANVGDTIKFIFWPTNHSVVRADFLNPCVPYYWFHEDGDTFFSGPKLSQTSDHPTWDLLVNDTEPTFFYCSAPGSCIDAHMVGAINPNDTYSLEKQQAALSSVKFQLSPGEPWPAESQAPTATPSSSPSSTGAPASATSTTPPVSSEGNSGGNPLSAGAIAGIAIGGAAVLIIAIALVWICGRKGGIEKGYRRSTVAHPSPAPMVEANYGNGPKSPPQGSFANSPFGIQHPEDPRSSSPAQWSQTGSPHNSYMGYPSPGLPSPYKDPHQPVVAYQDQRRPPPVELPENPHNPGASPPRHEFPG